MEVFKQTLESIDREKDEEEDEGGDDAKAASRSQLLAELMEDGD